MLIRKALFFLIGISIFFISANAAETPDVRKIRNAVYEATFMAPVTTMYRLTAVSETGTEIVLVDRMAGPVAHSGQKGKKNGIIYRILQKGMYKVILKTDKSDTTTPSLRVENTNPVDSKTTVEIKEHEIYSSELGDMQEKSWKLVVRELKDIHLEIMGRSLREVKIWQAGKWLLKTDLRRRTKTPSPGRYMNFMELNYRFSPGTYIITCYGGKKKQWPEEDSKNPLYLRMGGKYLGNSATLTSTISPFGQDYVIAGPEADSFELKLSKKIKGELKVKHYNPSQSWDGYYNRSTRIDKRWAEVRYSRGHKKLVAVRGKPGAKYTLNFFRNKKFAYIDQGRYWISTHPSLQNSAPLPVTATLYNKYRKKYPRYKSLSLKKGSIDAKINLTAHSEALVYINRSGSYSIHENSEYPGKGLYQFYPQFVKVKREIPWHHPGKEINLVKGYYLLKIRDVSRGILHFSLIPSSEKPYFTRPVVEASPIIWPETHLDSGPYRNHLKIIGRSGNASGLTVRELPVNPEEPLSIILPPWKKVPLDISLTRLSRLLITGDTPAIALNGVELKNNSRLKAGRYKLNISNNSRETIKFTLGTSRVVSGSGLKSADRAVTINGTGHIFTDFNRGETVNTILNISKTGFYRIETTGRLATSMVVRTVSDPELYKDSNSGSGRNSMVLKYLKPGSYYITVKALGRSKGRAGLSVKLIPPHTVKTLREQQINRNHIPPFSSEEYKFLIKKEGEYRINTRTLKASTQCMLLDSGNWPLIKPGSASDIKLYLPEGSYRYFTLPLQIRSRRLTELKHLVSKSHSLEGKGPHKIEMNKQYYSLWMETKDNRGDIYEIYIPAEMRVTLNLPPVLKSTVTTSAGKKIRSESGIWKGVLPEGRTLIEVAPLEKDNKRKYTISVQSGTLAPGLTLENLKRNKTIPVQVPANAMVQIFSRGASDVKAVLKNSKGDIVEESDDSASDWNFNIRKFMQKGRYFLHLTGRDNFKTSVSMRAIKLKQLSPRTIPSETEISAGSFPVEIPFTLSGSGKLVKIETGKDSNLTLSRGAKIIAQSREQIIIPLKGETRYQLSIWKENKSSDKVIIRTLEAETTKDTLIPSKGDGTIILSDNDTTFTIKQTSGSLLFSNSEETPLMSAGDTVSTSNGKGWFYGNTRSIKLKALSLKKRTTVNLGNEKLMVDIDKPESSVSLVEAVSVNLPVSATASGTNFDNDFLKSTITDRAGTLLPLPEGRKFRVLFRKSVLAPVPYSEKSMRNSRENVTLKIKHYRVQKSTPGSSDVLKVPPGEAYVINTDSWKSVNAAMSDNILIFSWKDNRPFRLATQQIEDMELSSRLYIVNRGKREGFAELTFSSGLSENRDIIISTENSSWEKFMNKPACTNFLLKSDSEIFIACKDFKYRIWNQDGVIVQKGHAEGIINPGKIKGLLEIDHGKGPLKVWLENSKSPENFITGSESVLDKRSGRIKIDTRAVTIKPGNSTSQYFCLSSNRPVKMQLKKGTTILKSAYIDRFNKFSYYLNGAGYTLNVQAVSGSATIELLLVKPEILDESSPPPVKLVSTRKPHVYMLNVKNNKTVGLGIKSSRDTGTISLLNSNSELLAHSPLIIRKLEGDYLVVVEADSKPLEYRLIIKGTLNNRKIPEEVILKYFKEKR